MPTVESILKSRFDQHFSTYRKLPSMGQYYPVLESPSREKVTLRFRNTKESREYVNFASSNYLDLNTRLEVQVAYREAFHKYGCGANGSPVLSGYYEPHHNLEIALARFHRMPDAVLFPSGYAANLSVVSSLLGPKDLLIVDDAIHGSIIDGGKLAQTRIRSFPHNDPEELREVLRRLRSQVEMVMVATLGVFSMSGSIAPLPEIVRLAKEYDCLLLLDEAHAVGVLGQMGRGTLEHFGLDHSIIDLCVGTLSKSIGGIGGYVTAEKSLTEFLRFNARPHVLSAAIPPTTAAGALAAVRLLESEGGELGGELRRKADLFRARLREAGIVLLGDGTGVAAFAVPDFEKLWAATNFLFEQGIFLNPVIYPAVRKDEGRMRYYINLGHSDRELLNAAEITSEAVRKFCR